MSVVYKAKPIREHFLPLLQEEVAKLKNKGVTPTLKIIMVGENKASGVYVRNKKSFAESINAFCEIEQLPENISEKDFLAHLDQNIKNNKIHGILVQLPLPHHLAHLDIASIIPPEKDVDGFHYETLGKILCNHKGNHMVPCTPMGIMTLLDFYQVPIAGKVVTVIGRSNIVGRPVAQLLTNKDATVTVCHSKTPDIKNYTKESDIIIVAIGKAKFLTKDYLSSHKAPVVIDVGINVNEKGEICGDVDFEDVKEHVSGITPVPGGIGPLTILSLAQNLIQTTKSQLNK